MLNKVKYFLRRARSWQMLRKHNVSHPSDLAISGKIYIDTAPTASISIGHGVSINSSYKANPVAGSLTKLIASNDAQIIIGDRVGISNATLYAFAKIEIEDDVLIGADCKLYDGDFHAVAYQDRLKHKKPLAKEIRIQKGAFLGAGVTVLKGVTIGKYAVVGAGSVVTKSIPDGQVWGGAPAKFIKQLEMPS